MKNAKQRLAEKEYDGLDSVANNFVQQVQKILSRIRKEPVQIWLKPKDRYKLLTLKIWSAKYCVSVEYILQKILPFWEGFVQRRSKKMKKQGLNVRVGTLTGKKSESILQEVIKKEFPNGQNKSLMLSQERERLYKLALDDDLKVKPKSLIDYSSPKRYVSAYSQSMKNATKERENFAKEMAKRPYRTNPFTGTI